MKSLPYSLRLSAAALFVVALAGCPSSDKCKNVTCTTGQTCNATTGVCEVGGVGGGNNGGGSAGGNQGGGDAGGMAGGNGGGTAGGNGGGGSTTTPIDPATFATEYVKALCDGALRCKELDQADYQTCLGAQGDQLANAIAKITAHVYGYNGSLAADCVNATKTAVCQTYSQVDACNTNIIYGITPNGGSCTASGDCDAGYCRTSTTACGTCVGFGAAGAACSTTPDLRCAGGLRCLNPNFDGGTCIAPGGVGQACGAAADCLSDAGYCPAADGGPRACVGFIATGMPCLTAASCATGLCPVVTDGGVRSCAATFADGTPCTTNASCTSKWCNSNSLITDAGTGVDTCGKLANGTACADHGDCTSGLCKGLRFDENGDLSVTGSCSTPEATGSTTCTNETFFNDSCADKLASCLDGSCQLTPVYSRAVGATCDDFDQCVTDAFCTFEAPDFLEGHCFARVATGAACTDSSECALGNFCGQDSAVCIAYTKPGQDCTDSEADCEPTVESCRSNNDGGFACYGGATTGGACGTAAPSCYASFCQTDAGVCAAKQAPGATCTTTAQCASGRCLNTDGGTADKTCQMQCF